MDPVLLLLLLLIALPVLSVVVMAAFAVTADFEFEDLVVRGGQLRGAVAAAVAKIIVGDAKTFQLPLLVTLRKTGIMGASTPILGGVTVRDLEWRISVDGEHAATITEAHSVRIGTASRIIELPVNAEVHPPGGLLRSLRRFQRTRAAGAEVRLDVEGHVIVKHWWMTREVPVQVTRHVVLGEPMPELERLEWVPAATKDLPPADEAALHVALANPYREEVLEARVVLQVVQVRRLRRDPVLALREERVRLTPGARWTRAFRVRVEAPRGKADEGAEKAVQVGVRLLWSDERLRPEDEPDEEEDGAGASQTTRLVAHPRASRGVADDRLMARLVPLGD